MDLVELNPLMDIKRDIFTGDKLDKDVGQTTFFCLDLIRSTFGNSYL